MQQMQQVGFTNVMPQGEIEQETQGAPFNIMQAKQGLDEREQLWRSVVADQQGQEIDAKGADITDEELKKYFGDQAGDIRELLNKRSDVKLSELLPLRNDASGLSQVVKNLKENESLQVSDMVTKGLDGRVKVDENVNDDETKELMQNRKDIKPKELTELKNTLMKALGNPTLVKKAMTSAAKLLKTRTDIKPEAVGDMFTKISDAMNSLTGGKGDKSASGAGAKLEMLETSVELLCTRRDLNTDQVVKLAQSTVKTMGDKDDGNSATRVSNSFKDAAGLMMARQDINVDQVVGFQNNLKQMVPGKDPAALDNRASMFSSACNLLKQRPDMNFDQVTELLKRQTQGTNPKQGNNLLQGFNNAISGLQKGQSMDQVAAPMWQQEQQRKQADQQRKPGEEAPRPGDPGMRDDKAGPRDGKAEVAQAEEQPVQDDAPQGNVQGAQDNVQGPQDDKKPGAQAQIPG